MIRKFGVIMLRKLNIIMLLTFNIIMLRTFSIMILRTFDILMPRTFIIILEVGQIFQVSLILRWGGYSCFSGLLTFFQKIRLPLNFSNVPLFLNVDVFRIIKVFPEIPTTTDFFKCPVFLNMNAFPDYERFSRDSDVHRKQRYLRKSTIEFTKLQKSENPKPPDNESKNSLRLPAS